MTKTNQKIICTHCGTPLSKDHAGPCPSCGKEGREIIAIINEVITISDSMRWQTRREFYEKNPKILIAVILITVISPFLGLFLGGPVGVVIGLALGTITFFISPRAITKVVEKNHGG